MQFDLANSPTPLSFGSFDRNGNRAPRAPPTSVTALKNGGPSFEIQDSRKDRGGMAQVFVEPEFEILLIESRNERMARVTGYEMSRSHAGHADFNRVGAYHVRSHRQ